MHKISCQKIYSKLKEIKALKKDFDRSFSNNQVVKYSNIHLDLKKKLEESEREFWPFEQEELSIENMKASYEKYKLVFEKSLIVKDDQIVKELLPQELKEEKFKMPTEQQFFGFLISRREQLEKMAKLGLVEPVLVPIAASFGGEKKGDNRFFYSGLLEKIALEIINHSKEKTLKGSDGKVLQPVWDFHQNSALIGRPIYLEPIYFPMEYVFKEKNGTFSESLDHTQFIQKHKDAGSPFPGFAIYFKEKGNLLSRERDKDDVLYDMHASRKLEEYRKSLHDLGLTGSTIHMELTLLLASLQTGGKMTRDSDNIDDAGGYFGGNSLSSTSDKMCYLHWNRSNGQLIFSSTNSHDSFIDIAGIAAGELI